VYLRETESNATIHLAVCVCHRVSPALHSGKRGTNETHPHCCLKQFLVHSSHSSPVQPEAKHCNDFS